MLWLWTEVKLSVKGEGSVEKRAVRHGEEREGWFMGHNLARTMGHNGNNIILRDEVINGSISARARRSTMFSAHLLKLTRIHHMIN